MTGNRIWQKLQLLRTAAIMSFILAMVLCVFLTSLAVINITKLFDIMVEYSHESDWLHYPEIIAAVIAGFAICLLFVFSLHENIKLRRMNLVFEDMAKTDVLTGIYNRRYLEDTLNKAIRSVSRSSGCLSVLMIDVDYFKNYNDTYGHNMGDNCLKMIAEILRQSISREEDFAARYGGEEFAVVLPHTDEEGAEIVASRLLENLRSQRIPHETSVNEKFVTFSIGGTSGIVRFTHSGLDYLKLADKALYLSKQNGRNRYTFLGFEP